MKSNLLWQYQLKDKDNQPLCIYDLAISPDGNLLLAVADQKIYVYDILKKSLIESLKGHKDNVYCICYAHDGKRFATGSADKQVIIWTSKMEGILKYSHNDSVRCVQYNPTSYQLLSCTSSDFGLWSPEQKNVTKIKVTSPINCCCWNEDGIIFALGFNSGHISIRFKNGDEKMKIERKNAIWGVLFFKTNDEKMEDRLSVVDWSTKSISIYDVDGNQNVQERNIGYDPLFISSLLGNEFFLIGGTNKQVIVYTVEGIALDTITTKESWIWCCKAHGNRMAIGCQDGTLSMYQISTMTVQCLHEQLYAYRHSSMTDVLVHQLNTNEKTLIKCRDLVKKIAIYKTLLAIQLAKRIVLYECNNEGKLNYRIKEKINTETINDCTMIRLCSSNLIIVRDENVIQSLNFNGKLEKEWNFKSSIKYLKTIGGVPAKESLLIGLKDGQVLMIFISNIIPVELIKIGNPIQYIDVSMKRQKVAIIDDKNNCLVYDLRNKQLIFEEPSVKSVVWNSRFDDLLCFAGSGFVAIKMANIPMQTIEFSDQANVIGYSGNKIYLQYNDMKIICHEIAYSRILLHYIQLNKFTEAYRIACLNVTYEDWQMLTNQAMNKCEFSIARKCFQRNNDWPYNELLYSYFQQTDSISNENRKQLLLAKYLAYKGLFAESAKLYKKINALHLAWEMFTDLQMYDQAKEYENHQNQQVSSLSVATADNFTNQQQQQQQRRQQSSNNNAFNDLQTLSKVCIAKGDYEKAFEIISKSDANSIVSFAEQIDKGEIKLLNLIAESFLNKQDYVNAIQIYRKIGDFKSLALTYIHNNQWEEALKICNDIPLMKQEIYFPYAMWLAENDRFAEAQKAFYESGKYQESKQVLERLLKNSIIENRFNDASYYSWLLANHCNQIYNDQQNDDEQQNNNNNNSNNNKRKIEMNDWQKLHEQAEIYHAYQYIYKYIEEPFTSVYAEILFNSALFLFQYIDGDLLPQAVSMPYILFALAKLGKTLGHYKLVRIAYKKLNNLRLPDKLSESIQIGSIEIRTKPFVDAEELSLFCYRCSSQYSLINGKLNRCVNCDHRFIHSFYSFDILPLVEFEINISEENFQKILDSNSDDNDDGGDKKSSFDQRQSPRRRTSLVNDSEVFTNDLLLNEKTESEQLTINFGDEINPETNVAILNEKYLDQLNHSNVIIVQDNVSDRNHYYLNMMPEIGIVACPFCHKFFYNDEYEFQILKNGNCLFCRQKKFD
ncbi:intraflagellar transport protein Oseg1 [Dermatophagoides farinae]|uniref:intraflagellar transport protein Oseg1 n=1 Tax=Dermatophagoides farinae TaxID=6954 RepID=UPI003F621CD1